MPTLFVCVGLPGSGKSTWARARAAASGALVVCRDDLRAMAHGGRYVFDDALEPLLSEWEEALVGSALQRGRDLIIDACNMRRLVRHRWICMAGELRLCGAQVATVRTVAVAFTETASNVGNRMRGDARGYPLEHWITVIERFRACFEPVEDDEGFDEVVRIDAPRGPGATRP